MNNATILLVVLAAVLAVFGGLAVVIPRLVQKGINLSGVLAGTGTVLDTADCVVDTLKTFLPGNEAIALIDRVIGWAQKAAEAAEQLYKTSKIEEAQRKDEATRLVYEFIAAAGWAVDRVLKIAKPLMEGEAVQAALIARGYHCGSFGASGVYERNTSYVVRCFQAANRLYCRWQGRTLHRGRAGRRVEQVTPTPIY